MYVIGKGGFGKVKQFKIISFNNSGLESFFQKIQKALCYERNGKSQNR